MKLARAEVMRQLDGRAMNEYGIPGVVLMENAGQATARAVAEAFGPMAGLGVTIFVGPGNNGGDGLVVARGLHQMGARVQVVMLVPEDRIKGDALVNWRVTRKLPVGRCFVGGSEDLAAVRAFVAHSAVLVDALFGTGLTRDVGGLYGEAIALMNESGKPVVAVDIPSGLDSDTGRVLGAAVRAELTVTYGLAKPGHFCYPGRELTGDLRVVDIGIPPEVVDEADIGLELVNGRMVASMLPARPANSHKGTFGHVLVAAGASGTTGAALLCARGALRSGAGLVSCAVSGDLCPIFACALLEAMTIPLPSRGRLAGDDRDAVWRALARKNAVVVGPGVGTAKQTAELVTGLYAEVDLPMVVDADGLNILAMESGVGGHGGRQRVLTPHPGEMARLTGLPIKEIQQDRIGAAVAFAREYGVFVVLKGAATVTAAPDGRAAVNPTGNAGMASGGMGDVLSGLIGGLLAQGLDPWRAARAGVYLHGLAADRIVEKFAIDAGFLATEVADEIPLAIAAVRRGGDGVSGSRRDAPAPRRAPSS